MTDVVFIGDEITAAAFRVAGVAVQVPAISDVPRVFEKAANDAELLIITASYARALNESSLRSAIGRADPLVLVMPDGGNRHPPAALDARIDRVLGIER